MLSSISNLFAGSLVALGCVCCCACPSDCCAASTGGACGCPGCPACSAQSPVSTVSAIKMTPEVQPTAIQQRYVPTARPGYLDGTRKVRGDYR
ncbi:MAG: hypothetical protein NTZ32_20580 [Planctomycetales bacterium]|nr:hypothetical protein [Planctomycetales bacterium]